MKKENLLKLCEKYYKEYFVTKEDLKTALVKEIVEAYTVMLEFIRNNNIDIYRVDEPFKLQKGNKAISFEVAIERNNEGKENIILIETKYKGSKFDRTRFAFKEIKYEIVDDEIVITSPLQEKIIATVFEYLGKEE